MQLQFCAPGLVNVDVYVCKCISHSSFVFRLSSFVFVPVPLPVPALVFVLLLLLLFLLTHDVCVGWGVLFVVVLLFLCVVCCVGSVSVCFLLVPSSLVRLCDSPVLLCTFRV